MYLIFGIVLLIGLIIVLIVIFHREIFKILDRLCESFRRFISGNAGFFKIIFILVFFVEQVIFIYLLDKRYALPKNAATFIGAFALVVITTASFQAFVWEHKYYHTKQQLRSVKYVSLLMETYEEKMSQLKRVFEKKSKEK